MKTTIVLVIEHTGEIPRGFEETIEAMAYDWLHARGVSCGSVVAREKPIVDLPVFGSKPYSLEGSPIKVSHE